MFSFTILINVLFPKAGIKIAGIPITFGSALLFLLILEYIFGIIQNQKLKKAHGITFAVLLSMAYWAIMLIGGWLIHSGERNPIYTVGNSFSFLISLVVFPLGCMITVNKLHSRADVEYIVRIIRTGIFITMVYALAQYALGIQRTTIPGITVNFSDYRNNPGGWWLEKYNGFGDDASKIVSTYQNGNIYGANLLLLVPVALSIPVKREWYKYAELLLFGLVTYLTGSRTVLFGFVFYCLLLVIRRIRMLHLKKTTLIWAGLFTVAVVAVLYKIISSRSDLVMRIQSALNWNTLFSATGRTEGLVTYLKWIRSSGGVLHFLFGSFGMNHEGWSYEMLYVCFFIYGGIVGLIISLWPWISGILGLNRLKNDPLARGLKYGLLTYAFVSLVDGAFWLIPTALNFWVILAISYVLIRLKGQYTFDDLENAVYGSLK